MHSNLQMIGLLSLNFNTSITCSEIFIKFRKTWRVPFKILHRARVVELPIWHPDGMRSLHDDRDYRDAHYQSERAARRQRRETGEEHEEDEIVADNPRPEDWLPQVMVEVCQDILQGLEALEAVRS